MRNQCSTGIVLVTMKPFGSGLLCTVLAGGGLSGGAGHKTRSSGESSRLPSSIPEVRAPQVPVGPIVDPDRPPFLGSALGGLIGPMRVRVAAQTFAELPSVARGHVIGYGVPIDAPDGTEGYVTSVGPAIRSAPGPDELLSVLEFVVNFTTSHADEVATRLLVVWLCDKLNAARGAGARHLTVDGEAVDPDDRVAVERAVSAHLYGLRQTSDRDDGE